RTASNHVMHMLGKRDATSSNYQLALNTDSGEGLVFGSLSAGNEVATGVDLPLNTWTHLAGTFDGTTYSFYMNGQLLKTVPGVLGQPNTAPLKIGGSDDKTTFGGLIDDVEIFNRALTPTEIQSISSIGSAGQCAVPPTITTTTRTSRPTPTTSTTAAPTTTTTSTSTTTTRPHRPTTTTLRPCGGVFPRCGGSCPGGKRCTAFVGRTLTLITHSCVCR